MASPADLNDPVAVVDADDHGAWVLICNAFGLTVILITLIIRVYIRVKVSPPFGTDDYLLAGATALASIQAGVVFAQVNHGFGKSIDLIDQRHLQSIQEFAYAADVLFIAGLYASKCCVVLFFKRISASKASALLAWSVLSLCLVFTVGSTLTVCLRCNLSHPWLWYNQACSGLGARWRAVAALDVVSEVLLFAMGLHLVWDLQTSIGRKAKVVFAFALRLLMILAIFVRLEYVEKQISSADPTLSGATSAMLTQIELFYSIVAATTPCLRPFLAAFVTNYGAMGEDTIMHGSHIGGSQTNASKGSQGTSFALRSLDSAKRATGRRNRIADPPQVLGPDAVGNRASANHGRRAHGTQDADSARSDESTRGMIIRKEVAWQVDSESYRTRSVSGARPEGGSEND